MDRRFNKKTKTKLQKLIQILGCICLISSIILLARYIFDHALYYHNETYLEYFFNWRLPDFLTQLYFVIFFITFFIKSIKLVNIKRRICISIVIWSAVGLFASLSWSFKTYFSFPVSPTELFLYSLTPGLLSTLLLLGTSIFLFVISYFAKDKLLDVKSLKKELLIDSKIDSKTRKTILSEPLDLSSVMNSLNCIKCGSNVDLIVYKVMEKKITLYSKSSTKYKIMSCNVPVCQSCGALYNLWYSIHNKKNRITLGAILSFSPCCLTLYLIFMWQLIAWYISLLGGIVISLIILKYKIYYNEKDSPFRNIKFKWGKKVYVKPDNFKKWTSFQDWELFNIQKNKTGDIPLSETEEKILNHLIEYQGCAFSPSALIKRVLGEKFTDKYLNAVRDLLKKMEKEEMIESDLHDGEFHYFIRN